MSYRVTGVGSVVATLLLIPALSYSDITRPLYRRDWSLILHFASKQLKESAMALLFLLQTILRKYNR